MPPSASTAAAQPLSLRIARAETLAAAARAALGRGEPIDLADLAAAVAGIAAESAGAGIAATPALRRALLALAAEVALLTDATARERDSLAARLGEVGRSGRAAIAYGRAGRA